MAVSLTENSLGARGNFKRPWLVCQKVKALKKVRVSDVSLQSFSAFPLFNFSATML